MRYIKLAACLTALAALTACSVGPKYVKPAAVVPPAFKEMSGWKVAQPRDGSLKGTWWEIFKDPQLNGLEQRVKLSNQNVIAAEAQFRQARGLVLEARSAYYPTVSVGASFSRSKASSTLGGIQGRSTSPVNDFSLPVSFSWEIDLWGRVRRTVEANRENAQASAADLAGATLSIQAELAQDYFQLRALDAQKQLFDKTVDYYRKYLELTKNRYDSGVASMADVAQAETQLKTTLAQAIDVGVLRALLEHAIAVLTGAPASTFTILAAPLDLPPPAVPVGVPSELLERRPDIAAAERRMAAANARIGVAEAAYYPTLTLGASGGFQSSSIAKWLSWPSRFWSLGPSISETVFDGGLRRAQTDEARAAYDATVASYRQATLVSFQEVEDNLAALRILEQEAAAQDEAVKASEETLTITTNQYKAGTLSYLNTIIAQANLLNNQKTSIDILSRRLTASVLLVKALGGGWDSARLPQAKELDKRQPPLTHDAGR